MNFQNLSVSKDFSKIFGVLLGMNLQLFYLSRQISSNRKRIFNLDFMQKHFGTLHKQQLNQQIQHMGYPDSGNNIYSRELSYKDWYQFNLMQKLYQDHLQDIPPATLSVLCSGAVNTKYGIGIGLGFIFGKIIQRWFYPRQKNQSKMGTRTGRFISKSSIVIGLVIFFVQLIKR